MIYFSLLVNKHTMRFEKQSLFLVGGSSPLMNIGIYAVLVFYLFGS